MLQAGSLRSGSVSHLNKHGPAEDGGEFVEAEKKLLHSMKPSKPVSFRITSIHLTRPKFRTNGSECLTAQIVTEAVGVAPLPNRLWFLSYRDTMNHRSAVYLLWSASYGVMGSETANKVIIVVQPCVILSPSCRLRCLRVFPQPASYKVYEAEALRFARLQ